MWSWILHYTGFNDPSGKWSAFWSGFGGDLGYFAGLGVLLRRMNCHVSGCWRLGVHRLPGTSYATCHRHHPDHKDRPRPSAAEIAIRYGNSRPDGRDT